MTRRRTLAILFFAVPEAKARRAGRLAGQSACGAYRRQSPSIGRFRLVADPMCKREFDGLCIERAVIAAESLMPTRDCSLKPM